MAEVSACADVLPRCCFCRKEGADAKNYIRDFIRSRTALNCGKNCFKKESCTLAIFRTEVEIFCLIAKSCVTWVGIESPWLAPVIPKDLKLRR